MTLAALLLACASSDPPFDGATGGAADTAVGTTGCAALDEVAGASFVPETGACSVDVAPEPACASDAMPWWSGDGCPTFAEYVAGVSAWRRLGCDDAWSYGIPTLLRVERCVSASDGAPIDEVHEETCDTDVCSGTDARFDATGRLLSLRAWVSGRLQPVCCEATLAPGGRSWGPVVELDCSSAEAYAPGDLLDCGSGP